MKIINCLKAGADKLMSNAEIRDMIKAFGLDLNPKTGKVIIDEKKLRYTKIIISADADVDGAHIQSLFYTFLWSFCPELIEKGYVYATVPPLFRVTKNKKYTYLQDDKALDEYRAKYPNGGFQVSRNKGLGEMSVEELEETVLHPETRTLKQLTLESYSYADKIFDDLMGASVTPRKKFIEEHSAEATI